MVAINNSFVKANFKVPVGEITTSAKVQITRLLCCCVVVDCDIPVTPSRSTVELLSGTTTFRSEARYECDDGYNLNGDMLRTCASSGVWEPEAPTCSRE